MGAFLFEFSYELLAASCEPALVKVKLFDHVITDDYFNAVLLVARSSQLKAFTYIAPYLLNQNQPA